MRQKISLEPENMDARLQAIDNFLSMENMTEAAWMAEAMIARWPSRQEPWLAKLKVCQHSYDREGIQSVLREVKKRNIYLTPEARSVLRFWEEEGKEEQESV